jgi:hypothetical protein
MGTSSEFKLYGESLDSDAEFKVQIDWSGNGSFGYNETVYNLELGDDNSFILTPPFNAQINEPLRCRVSLDISDINSGCVLYGGRVVDYSIMVSPQPAAPIAQFFWELVDECERLYQLNDASLNEPTSWNWNFGDGQVSELQNPQHIFTETGWNLVTLVASNDLGSDTHDSPIFMPFSGFSGIAINGEQVVGQELSFVPSGYSDFANYTWNFGDGNETTSTSAEASHTYQEPGEYQVTVSVDADVCVSEFTTSVNIQVLSAGFPSLSEGVVLYPNPSTGNFNLSFSSLTAIGKLELFDALGKRVDLDYRELQLNDWEIHVGKPIIPGIYLLVISTEVGAVHRAKLILE